VLLPLLLLVPVVVLPVALLEVVMAILLIAILLVSPEQEASDGSGNYLEVFHVFNLCSIELNINHRLENIFLEYICGVLSIYC
jgi:hypothetical protein